MAAEDRYSRNELLFGAEGQKRISEARVGIVGLGGLGSHVAQQLSYLGVLDYALVDGDVVTDSSLNRLVGANDDDVGTAKVAVAKRMIESIQPKADVDVVQAKLSTNEARDALRDRTFVFGCLDKEAPRLQLTDFASEHRITYIDAASDVDPDGEFGGRIVVANGSGCLFCLGEIDQEELRREQLTPEQRQAHDETYGIPRGALDETGPSVVSLNGVVASLAVNEFMVSVTGMVEPALHLIYRGRSRMITRSSDPPEASCPYCGRWW